MSADELRQQARQRRRTLGLGQEDVAKRAGVSKGTVQNFELGKSTPHQDNLASILKVLGIDPLVPPSSNGVAAGPPLLDENEPRAWPADVAVFLDMMGVYLMRYSEEKRLQLIHALTRQIFTTPPDAAPATSQ